MADLKDHRRPADRGLRHGDDAAADHGGRAGLFRGGRLRGAARHRDAAARAGLAGRRPQDRLHQPHDLAALWRVPADVGARLDPHRAFRARTAMPRCRCMRLVQPRIEPEVVFKLKGAGAADGRSGGGAGVRRMDRAGIRDRAEPFSGLEVRRGRLHRGVRAAWRAGGRRPGRGDRRQPGRTGRGVAGVRG